MKYIIALLLVSIFIVSCKNNTKSKNSSKKENVEKIIVPKDERTIINAGSKINYVGKPGRVLIVSDNTVYVDEIAHIFDSIFGEKIRPYYPPTPYFTVFHRNMQDFQRLSKGIRNVIELQLNDTIPVGKPIMRIYENYYAKTQLYTRISANNINDLYQKITEEISFLFKIYDRQEWKREYLRHARNKNMEIRDKLKRKFSIDLIIPGDTRFESVDNTYGILLFPSRSRQMDLQTEGTYSSSVANYIQSGLMVWQYPFKDSSQFDEDNILQMRDTILKKYAKHELRGVYMGTQYFGPVYPQFQRLRIGNIIGYQVRGLYKFTGRLEPSGGRFWGFHFKHPTKNTIIALSGYIDAPPTMSPAFDLNRIRAVLYSLQTID